MKTTQAVLPVSMWSVRVDQAVSAYLASEYHVPERLEGEEGRHSEVLFPPSLYATTFLIFRVALPPLVQHAHLLQTLHNVREDQGQGRASSPARFNRPFRGQDCRHSGRKGWEFGAVYAGDSGCCKRGRSLRRSELIRFAFYFLLALLIPVHAGDEG